MDIKEAFVAQEKIPDVSRLGKNDQKGQEYTSLLSLLFKYLNVIERTDLSSRARALTSLLVCVCERERIEGFKGCDSHRQDLDLYGPLQRRPYVLSGDPMLIVSPAMPHQHQHRRGSEATTTTAVTTTTTITHTKHGTYDLHGVGRGDRARARAATMMGLQMKKLLPGQLI